MQLHNPLIPFLILLLVPFSRMVCGISNQLKDFHAAVDEAKNKLEGIKNTFGVADDKIMRQRRRTIDELLSNFEDSVNIEQNMADRLKEVDNDASSDEGVNEEYERQFRDKGCKSNGKCGGNWKYSNGKKIKKSNENIDELNEIAKLNEKYDKYKSFRNDYPSIMKEFEELDNQKYATSSNGLVNSSDLDESNLNVVYDRDNQNTANDLYDIINMNPTRTPYYSEVRLGVYHKGFEQPLENEQGKTRPLSDIEFGNNYNNDGNNFPISPISGNSDDNPSSSSNQEENNYLSNTYDGDLISSYRGTHRFSSNNDQFEVTKNDLSHEADYKLSKIEQDAAEKRKPQWDWSESNNDLLVKRAIFNPMNEIKLKTSSRLMSKGFGASLPSYALIDPQFEERLAHAEYDLDNEVEDKKEEKKSASQNDLDKIEQMLSNFETMRRRKQTNNLVRTKRISNIADSTRRDNRANNFDRKKRENEKHSDVKATKKGEDGNVTTIAGESSTDKNASNSVDLKNDNNNNNSTKNHLTTAAKASSKSSLRRQKRSEDDIMSETQDFDTMERNEDDIHLRFKRAQPILKRSKRAVRQLRAEKRHRRAQSEVFDFVDAAHTFEHEQFDNLKQKDNDFDKFEGLTIDNLWYDNGVVDKANSAESAGNVSTNNERKIFQRNNNVLDVNPLKPLSPNTNIETVEKSNLTSNIPTLTSNTNNNNKLRLSLQDHLHNCSAFERLQNYLSIAIGGGGGRVSSELPPIVDNNSSTPKLLCISTTTTTIRPTTTTSPQTSTPVVCDPATTALPTMLPNITTPSAMPIPQSDNIKINININATMEGQTDLNKLLGNATIKVEPAAFKEERGKRGILSTANAKGDGKEFNDLTKCSAVKHYGSRPNSRKNMNRPHTHTNKVKTYNGESCNSKGENSSSCASGEKSMEDLISGQLSSQVVKSVFGLVRTDPKLQVLWPSLEHNKPLSKQQMTNFYSIRNEANEATINRSEQMLKKTMQTINQIIDEQVRTRTCISLRPDLIDFYEMILKTYESQEKTREKRETSLLDLNSNFSKQVRAIDANRIEERSRVVKKLLHQYDNLPEEDRAQVSGIRDDLLMDLMFLRKLRDSQKMLQERHKRNAVTGETESKFIKVLRSDPQVLKKLNAQYSPGFLRLWKTSELFREASFEQDQI